MFLRKAIAEPKWETHPSLLRKPPKVSRSNSSAAVYQSTDFKYGSTPIVTAPRTTTSSCASASSVTSVTPRCSNISNNSSDLVPQVRLTNNLNLLFI